MKGGGSPQASEQPSASKRNSSVWSDKTSWLSNLRSQHRSKKHVQQKLFLKNMQKYSKEKRHQVIDPKARAVQLPIRKVPIALKPHHTITKPKDPVQKDQVRGIICSIPCKDCDKLYIGGQNLKQKSNSQLREHQKALEQTHPKKSALAEHCLQSGHAISWQSSTILRTNTSWRNRPLLEAWEINACKSPLINRYDGMYLPQEYRALTLLGKS